MHTSPNIHLLTQIHQISGQDAQRAAFRRGMADLAAVGSGQRLVPFEGMDPDALGQSIQGCAQQGFLDDLAFLSSEAAAVALYQLAAALPKGPLRKSIGRRVLHALIGGDAQTFGTLAATLAMAGKQPFSTPELRARVALSLEMPAGQLAIADTLALCLLARPYMLREWVILPASRSLAERRLAARIIERAARQAVRQSRQGDDAALELFGVGPIQEVWQRLLRDRESLVWRHVAIARGFLSTVMHEHEVALTSALDPGLSPTEWRRGAVSAVASVVQGSEEAISRCAEILHGPLKDRDPGLLSVMVYGVEALAESEPGLAQDLLTRLVEHGGDHAMESLVELLREGDGSYAGPARAAAVARLRSIAEDAALGDAKRRHARLRLTQLSAVAGEAPANDAADVLLPYALRRAKLAYAQQGAESAFALSVELLQMAEAQLERLQSHGGDADSLRWLWELDATLLQSSTLANLARLSTQGESRQRALEALERLRQRMHGYLLEHERAHGEESMANGMSMRRLITLLHAVDVEFDSSLDRQRRLEVASALLVRAIEESQTPLSRVLCATLARTFDALVRDETLELSDVLLAAARYVHQAKGIRVLAEASMDPQIEAALFAYADLVAVVEAMKAGAGDFTHTLGSLQQLVRAIPVAGSPRVEALRRALLDIHRELEVIAFAPNLAYLCEERGSAAIGGLADGLAVLHQLWRGTLRRVFDKQLSPGSSIVAQSIGELLTALERSQNSGDAVPWPAFLEKLSAALIDELPASIAFVVGHVFEQLRSIPKAGRTTIKAPPLTVTATRRLPRWLPPNRIIGGYYVVDALGAGAVGSVFVATRAEERGRHGAQRFALKVPMYDAQTAGELSEEEFLAMFRKEAGALLALPQQHPNLASFVTFDAGARPKPALVMELVTGPTLARLLARGQQQTEMLLHWLLGVANGLAAMHQLGIGHLDVKPGNIVVCQGAEATSRAVLVDFGLSGRAIRPSCATAAYGAPEIWGLLPEQTYSDPRPADVYAFACTVFEALTCRDVFPGNDDMALIAAHLRHDGRPDAIVELGQQEETGELSQLLSCALRQDPHKRIGIVEFAARLRDLAPRLAQLSWPLLPRENKRAA